MATIDQHTRWLERRLDGRIKHIAKLRNKSLIEKRYLFELVLSSYGHMIEIDPDLAAPSRKAKTTGGK